MQYGDIVKIPDSYSCFVLSGIPDRDFFKLEVTRPPGGGLLHRTFWGASANKVIATVKAGLE